LCWKFRETRSTFFILTQTVGTNSTKFQLVKLRCKKRNFLNFFLVFLAEYQLRYDLPSILKWKPCETELLRVLNTLLHQRKQM